jgi:outer membrane protein
MKTRLLILILFISYTLRGQEVLDEYIRAGLENNLTLKQKQTGYEKSLEALKEARGLFYPNISFNARYSVASGGRTIDFPVGQLLNPVYSTLNALTSSSSFSSVQNMQIRFMRPTEHETKIRLTQPVLNGDIYYNSKIRKEYTVFEEADVEQYRRELVAEIKKSYYNVNMCQGIFHMLEETRRLLLENVRVNRKLAENDKLTIDNVYRSEAELSKFDQEIQEAWKNRELASAYFNFLINRSLNDTIITSEPAVYPVLTDAMGDISKRALENREELKKLNSYSKMSSLDIKRNEMNNLPDIFIAVDYGYQGEKYQFNSKQDYTLASAILRWDLFSGFQNKAKTRQAILQKEIVDNQLEEARREIELQVINTMNELLTAEKGIGAAESRLRNAKEGFRLVNRKYGEGQAGLLEFLDARTTLTQAEENLIISKFAYLSAYAEFEKVTAINITYNSR